VYQAVWVENTDFDEVLISPTMVNDHMPEEVMDALQKVTWRCLKERLFHIVFCRHTMLCTMTLCIKGSDWNTIYFRVFVFTLDNTFAWFLLLLSWDVFLDVVQLVPMHENFTKTFASVREEEILQPD
jgi:hypothetical protein